MGRDNFPWWRKSHRCYYVNRGGGRQVRLDPDKKRAFEMWHALDQDPGPQGPGVGEKVDEYLSHVERTQKSSSLRCKRKTLLPYKKDRGGKPLSGETAAVVVEWVCSHRTWGRSMRWQAGTVVKAMLRWAGLPIGKLGLPGPLSRGKEAIVPEEALRKLLEAAPPWYQDALNFLHATGCRPGEMVALEARHVHGNVAVLDEHKTEKGGTPRLIILAPTALAIVQRLMKERPEGKLFRNRFGNPIKQKVMRNWLVATRERLGLGRVMLYGLRHTMATDALSKGVPDAIVAQLLGHAGTATLFKHYSHLTSRVAALVEHAGNVRPG